LPAGMEIGPGKPFQAQANCMAFSESGSANGPWLDVKHRYLGFAFMIEGKVHYGWARLSLGRFVYNYTAELTGYAYETIANKSLLTGKEKSTDAPVETAGATLGSLARGASSLPAGRNK